MSAYSAPELTAWREVWERKGRECGQSPGLQELQAVNGYDRAGFRIASENWLTYVDAVRSKLGIAAGDSVCEVGCGSGAFLLPIYRQGAAVWGSDYAQSMIPICRQVMPEGTFEVGEATSVPFPSGAFDFVLSNGVFFYFPDLNYAESAVKEIARLLKPGGHGAILDVNDARKRDGYVAMKKQELGESEDFRMYTAHPHLFFEKAWFMQVAGANGLSCVVEDQMIAGYANSGFRFNVFLEKL